MIAELINLAKDVVAEAARGARFTPPLDEDQLAFFDAVATNESAVDVMGEGSGHGVLLVVGGFNNVVLPPSIVARKATVPRRAGW